MNAPSNFKEAIIFTTTIERQNDLRLLKKIREVYYETSVENLVLRVAVYMVQWLQPKYCSNVNPCTPIHVRSD